MTHVGQFVTRDEGAPCPPLYCGLHVAAGGGGGIVVLDAAYIDFMPSSWSSPLVSPPVNVSGGNTVCGNIGGAGTVFFKQQAWLACYSGVSTPYGITATMVDLVSCSRRGVCRPRGSRATRGAPEFAMSCPACLVGVHGGRWPPHHVPGSSFVAAVARGCSLQSFFTNGVATVYMSGCGWQLAHNLPTQLQFLSLIQSYLLTTQVTAVNRSITLAANSQMVCNCPRRTMHVTTQVLTLQGSILECECWTSADWSR